MPGRLGLQPVPVFDDVGPRDHAELPDVPKADEARELRHVEAIRPLRPRVVEVGQPLGLGRQIGELVEALLRQEPAAARRQLFLGGF